MATSKSLEEKFNELENKYKLVQKEKEEIQKKYDNLKNEKSMYNPTRNRHDNKFWLNVKHQMDIGNTDAIKAMIKNGKLSQFDINHYEETILIMASKKGCYDIVQLCINSGASLDHKDKDGKTAVN